mmetsp:Transcript_4140/g.12119  ORF Transcript_4140/g.12119 Transcript_4140/m.12119 type:complete len:248 (-) Transcript_4140:126-869(-)
MPVRFAWLPAACIRSLAIPSITTARMFLRKSPRVALAVLRSSMPWLLYMISRASMPSLQTLHIDDSTSQGKNFFASKITDMAFMKSGTRIRQRTYMLNQLWRRSLASSGRSSARSLLANGTPLLMECRIWYCSTRVAMSSPVLSCANFPSRPFCVASLSSLSSSLAAQWKPRPKPGHWRSRFRTSMHVANISPNLTRHSSLSATLSTISANCLSFGPSLASSSSRQCSFGWWAPARESRVSSPAKNV